jgi:hypothetical protein
MGACHFADATYFHVGFGFAAGYLYRFLSRFVIGFECGIDRLVFLDAYFLVI